MQKNQKISPLFWKEKSLLEMNDDEWEALCDGCGLCCYQKYITGHGKRERIHHTRVACDLLNLKTGKCNNYPNRFKIIEECTKLTKKNLLDFKWLPETCAYRLVYEGKDLYNWHYLVCGDITAVKKAEIVIINGVYEKDIIDWFDYII